MTVNSGPPHPMVLRKSHCSSAGTHASVEKVYLGKGNEILTPDLRETMVKLYKAILE